MSLWFRRRSYEGVLQRDTNVGTGTLGVEQMLPSPITICARRRCVPGEERVYRVAERHLGRGVALKVFVVSNRPIAVPRDVAIERVVVGAGMDAADHWIAERAGAGSIVVTADVPLATAASKPARRSSPTGRPFHRRLDRHDAGDPQPDGFAAFPPAR